MAQMVCCAIIAALLGLLTRPLLTFRRSPLAWRPRADMLMVGRVPMRSTGRLQSFRHAVAGLRFLARNEPNMRIHLLVAGLTVPAGLWLRLGISEWRWVVLAIALVLVAEALNTAVEQACNAITAAANPAIKAAKDVSAGAVLVAAMAAALIGATVFTPHLFNGRSGLPQYWLSAICGGGE